MCARSWSNFATSCSRPMKLLHYVSQAPHTNICNSIMHKDLQNAEFCLQQEAKPRGGSATYDKCLRVLRDALVSQVEYYCKREGFG